MYTYMYTITMYQPMLNDIFQKKDFAQKPRSQEICLPDSGRSYCLQWILRLLLGPWSTALEDRVGQQHVWVIQWEIHGTVHVEIYRMSWDSIEFSGKLMVIYGMSWGSMRFWKSRSIKHGWKWLEMAINRKGPVNDCLHSSEGEKKNIENCFRLAMFQGKDWG